ncbi:hypothetical protein ES703_50230 [subsurface metagenome]
MREVTNMSKLDYTRRDFLKTLGLGAAGPAPKQILHDSGFIIL